MACLIKDKLTGEFVGYKNLTSEEKLRIEREGDYSVVPFYNAATCKRVLGIKESEV